jgi:hypothetical protein
LGAGSCEKWLSTETKAGDDAEFIIEKFDAIQRGETMKKHKYVRATLTLEPTRKAAAEMKKARASIQGPLTGTLVLTKWLRQPITRLTVEGSLKPIASPVTKPKKTKARRARKEEE